MRTSHCPLPDFSQPQYGGITIPGDYDYWGCLEKQDRPQGIYARHDYCTWSHFRMPATGTNAVFEGACPRHDMRYDEANTTSNGVNPCNRKLREDMETVCDNVYSPGTATRLECHDYRQTYWALLPGPILEICKAALKKGALKR